MLTSRTNAISGPDWRNGAKKCPRGVQAFITSSASSSDSRSRRRSRPRSTGSREAVSPHAREERAAQATFGRVSRRPRERERMSQDPDDSLGGPDDSPTEPTRVLPSTGVTRRTLIAAVIVASLLSIGAAVAISAAVLKQGPPGSRGPAGPEGRAGEAEVDPDAVWEAVE